LVGLSDSSTGHFHKWLFKQSGKQLMENIRNFLADESGANAVEYCLIITLIAGAIVIAVTLLGQSLSPKFGPVTTAVQNQG
jgi:pilus assembly protein Flp/PilA